MKLLLARGADVNVRDSRGYTALMHLADNRCNYKMEDIQAGYSFFGAAWRPGERSGFK